MTEEQVSELRLKLVSLGYLDEAAIVLEMQEALRESEARFERWSARVKAVEARIDAARAALDGAS